MKTKAFQIRKNSPSLRATIPEAIAQTLKIEHGNEIEWIITTVEGELAVLIKKG